MKSVRRITAVLSALLMVASLVACNGNKEPETTTAETTTVPETTKPETTADTGNNNDDPANGGIDINENLDF